jgi:hypothetical protein
MGGIFRATHSFAQAEELKWEPAPLDEIRAIWHDRPLSDIEIVRALVDHLDRRISVSRLHDPKVKPSPPNQYALLIGLIAERPYPAKPTGRPDAVEAVIRSLGPVENEEEVLLYLNLSVGLAGGSPSEEKMLRVLTDSRTPEEIIFVALQSMSRSTKVPIRSLPRLLELSDHPMSSITTPSCVGPAAVERKFPIRDLVLECLTKLNIRAERIMVDDGTVDPATGTPLPATHVKIDRGSLAALFRDCVQSADVRIWKAALDAIIQIPGDDMDKLVEELEVDRTLAGEKGRYLRSLRQ